MVLVCEKKYPDENEKLYKPYFLQFPYPLSDFQKYAIEATITGNHALVCCPTGCGKTLPAEFAIEHFVSIGKRVIYTSPIKALTNQKYYEFSQKYPHISFGIMTGDIKSNPTANVLLMTAEILMNYLLKSGTQSTNSSPTSSLLFEMDIQNELGCVIMDEIHYINDFQRGAVWEKTILLLPPQVQMVMLSATIDTPTKFAEWCEWNINVSQKQVYLCRATKRIVPLTHYGFLTTNETIFKKIKDKTIQQQIRNSTNKLITFQEENGQFIENGYNEIVKIQKLMECNQIYVSRNHVLNQLCLYLKEHEMLPAIFFVFSRKNVEIFAKEITTNLLEDDSKIPYIVSKECEQMVRKLPNYEEYLKLPEYCQLVSLLEKGIGIHHSGMIPILREIVECMISKKYIKVLLATESFAIGLSCPIRTAVFTSLTKYDGLNERFLYSHEYTQTAGRAGRRGIDTIGNVIHCNNLFHLPTLFEYKTILNGKPQTLSSKFHISVSFVLHFLASYFSGEPKPETDLVDKIIEFISKSMMNNETQQELSLMETKIEKMEKEVLKNKETIQYVKTPIEICNRYYELLQQLPTVRNKKQKEVEREIKNIQENYFTIKPDSEKIVKWNELKMELNREQTYLMNLKNDCFNSVNNCFQLLLQKQFIQYENNQFTLTQKGCIGSNMAEINPIIMSEFLIQTNFLRSFSIQQIIGFLSCFTDIKIPQDISASIPTTEDLFIKNNLQLWNTIENEYVNYDICIHEKTPSSIKYDIIDITIKWCNCTNETECKFLIQTELKEKMISIGDFTKALLKISNIGKELIHVCEIEEQLELLEKLHTLDFHILKFVATSQSLYI
jgi:superfamily II RNA helicase